MAQTRSPPPPSGHKQSEDRKLLTKTVSALLLSQQITGKTTACGVEEGMKGEGDSSVSIVSPP